MVHLQFRYLQLSPVLEKSQIYHIACPPFSLFSPFRIPITFAYVLEHRGPDQPGKFQSSKEPRDESLFWVIDPSATDS